MDKWNKWQVISIWRPKAPPGWFSVGDVTSRGLSSPAGAVVVKADATGCLVSKPAKFRVVHQDKTTGYVVWRPVARKGQVGLVETVARSYIGSYAVCLVLIPLPLPSTSNVRGYALEFCGSAAVLVYCVRRAMSF